MNPFIITFTAFLGVVVGQFVAYNCYKDERNKEHDRYSSTYHRRNFGVADWRFLYAMYMIVGFVAGVTLGGLLGLIWFVTIPLFVVAFVIYFIARLVVKE